MALNPAGTPWGERFPYPTYLAVAVRVTDGAIVKGFLENVGSSPSAPESLLFSKQSLLIHQEMGATSLDLGTVESVFFVRSLVGESERQEMKFLNENEEPTALWVRAQCTSLEVLEGSTENSLDLFTGDGFFLRPADLHSNNMLIYVFKARLRRLQVMGLQTPMRVVKSGSSARTRVTRTGNV